MSQNLFFRLFRTIFQVNFFGYEYGNIQAGEKSLWNSDNLFV